MASHNIQACPRALASSSSSSAPERAQGGGRWTFSLKRFRRTVSSPSMRLMRLGRRSKLGSTCTGERATTLESASLLTPHLVSTDHSFKSAAGVAWVTTCRIIWFCGKEGGAVRLQNLMEATAEVSSVPFLYPDLFTVLRVAGWGHLRPRSRKLTQNFPRRALCRWECANGTATSFQGWREG